MNRVLRLCLLVAAILTGFPCTGSAQQTIFFTNPFVQLQPSGWNLDGTVGAIDTSVFSPLGAPLGTPSSSSLKFHWQSGNSDPDPTWNGALRRYINGGGAGNGVETIYVAFDIKSGDSVNPWVGSGAAGFHPHLFYLLSDADAPAGGLASNFLDTYIEIGSASGGNSIPRVALQDSKRIFTGTVGGQAYPTNNPTPITGLLGTPNPHAVAGGNGKQNASSGYGGGINGMTFDGASRVILNDTWHRIEVYLAMNSINGSNEPQADGIIQFWVDGSLQIDLSNVYFRTAQYSTMKWKTIVIGPYMNSSPANQTMWIDNLVVANQRSASQTSLPSPANLRLR